MRTAVLVVLLAACGGSSGRAPRAPSPGAATLTVMSYNVNYGLGGDAEGLRAIELGDADLVVLQETTPRWERAIRAELAGAYPHMTFHHCCGAGGLAILSRGPITEGEVLPASVAGGWFPAVRAVVETPVGAVQVLAVHLRPPLEADGGLASVVSAYGSTRPVREREIEVFARALRPELPTLVVGDFNEEDGGRAVRLLADRGLRSALPEIHPEADTWAWPTSFGAVSRQLDHIVYDGARLDALDARVLEAGRSDHRPVVAVFERVE